MTTDTESKTWEEMTPEEQAAFQHASDARLIMWKYNQYQGVADAILGRYDVPWGDAVEAACDHVTGLEEQAAEDAREEANNNAEEVAEEIASSQSWVEQDEDDE